MAVIGAASAFIESTLAQIWKVRGKNGEFRGGPAYYIQQALGKRWLGVVFAILLILCFAFGFNGLQAFNMTSALEYYIPDYATNGTAIGVGIVLVVMTAFVIFGGARRISVITSIIVPVMAIAYIALALWTTFTNLGEIPAVFSLIFASAFDFQSIFGGFAGSVVMLGIKRGLFSNEAGMGSAPNAAATASVSHPVKQGLVQSLSVYIDTLVICTCSAMMVHHLLRAGPRSRGRKASTACRSCRWQSTTRWASWASTSSTFAIFAFAFSSLIGNYFYAESNLRFIKDNKVCADRCSASCAWPSSMYGCREQLRPCVEPCRHLHGLHGHREPGRPSCFWASGRCRALDDYTAQRKAGHGPGVPCAEAHSRACLPTECWHLSEVRGLRPAARHRVPGRRHRRRLRGAEVGIRRRLHPSAP